MIYGVGQRGKRFARKDLNGNDLDINEISFHEERINVVISRKIRNKGNYI